MNKKCDYCLGYAEMIDDDNYCECYSFGVLTPYDWENPQWNEYHRVHNWRNYVSNDVKEIWNTFTDTQKLLLAQLFEELAGNEEWN